MMDNHDLVNRSSATSQTAGPELPTLEREPSSPASPTLTRVLTAVVPPKVGRLAKRIHGWTWQCFPVGLGTGAVYVVLSGLKYHSNALNTIEKIFYFLNIALFLLNTSTLLLQAMLYPRRAWALVQDPVKSIFIPLMVLTFATIIIGTVDYAVPSGHVGPNFIYVLFWIYVALALIVSCLVLITWFNKPHDLTHFTPTYAFLVFPIMLTGVVAFNVLDVMTSADPRALGVLLTGYFFLGIGLFMSLFYLCIFIIRIMTTGFLEGHQANGAFVVCGPPGFTCLALIKLGANAQEILPQRNLISPLAGEIWYAGSVLSGFLLFALAIFFFFFGLIPYWSKLHRQLHEILGCWALTFPNVGWISSLRVLGDVLGVPGFYTVHLVMAIIMCLTWLVLFALTLLAFWKGLIFISTDSDVIQDMPFRHHQVDIEKGQ